MQATVFVLPLKGKVLHTQCTLGKVRESQKGQARILLFNLQIHNEVKQRLKINWQSCIIFHI